MQEQDFWPRSLFFFFGWWFVLFFFFFFHMDSHMFYHRFHTFGARIHMFSFCSNKRLKSFFIISFFLAGVFADVTECDARCLGHTQIGCSWISSEVFKNSTWGVQGLDYLLTIMPLDSARTMQGVLSSDCKVLARLFPYSREAPLKSNNENFFPKKLLWEQQ